MDYLSLFTFALSVALHGGAEDPENMAQEAIVMLWLQGECEYPKALVKIMVRRMLAKERAGREKLQAEQAKVRYRPRKEGEWGGVTEGFEQAVMEKVLVEQIRERWKYPRRKLREVRAWIGI